MATPLGVEIFSVVTGPLRLMEDNPKPIKPDSYQKESARFQAEIAKGVRAFLKAPEAKPAGDEPPYFDYFETNRKVSKAFAQIGQEGTLEARLPITAQLPDPLLGAQYSLQFDKVVAFLQNTLPRRTYTTLGGGIQNAEPPALEMSPFWRAWEVVNDPRVLLRDLGEHILVTDQVEVTKQLYPEIYGEYTKAMLEGMEEQRTASADWEPTMGQAQQIEVMLLISRFDPNLAAELQERARQAEVQERTEEKGQPALSDQAASKAVENQQTPTQRVSYR
jgi:hypothetical protein